MPQPSKGARIWLKPERRLSTGSTERAAWVIRDGKYKRSTGCSQGDIEGAERALHTYISEKHTLLSARSRSRHPSVIPIADVLNIYAQDLAGNQARPKETTARIAALAGFFGNKMLSDINGRACRDYALYRGSAAAARRELEDFRAAINHHRQEGHCSEIVGVVLPERGPSRERWLTRAETARLIWAAWRYREVQKGKETDRRSRRHVARFMLVALYTGSRAGVICGAALQPTAGRGWIDTERGVFYRRADGERETKKRKPPIILPPSLLGHLRRWKRHGQRYAVEWRRRPVKDVDKALRAVVTECGLEGNVTPHTFRHTAATWQMQAGTDLWEAAGFLGMTVEVLQRVYGHHHPDHQKGAVAAYANHRSPRPTVSDSLDVNKTGYNDPNVRKFS
jgi:integrase